MVVSVWGAIEPRGEMAREFDSTLVGFLREGHFNVFSWWGTRDRDPAKRSRSLNFFSTLFKRARFRLVLVRGGSEAAT